MKIRNAAILLATVVAVFGALPTRAATFYVNKNGGSDGNGGSDWSTDAWLTIQYAIDNVNATGDVIQVSEGTFVEDVLFSSTGTNTLTLKGGYDDSTWVWGPGTNRSIIKATSTANDVITINSHNNTIIGFTLTGGDEGIRAAVGTGGDSLHTITHCIITNNAGRGIELNDAKSALKAINCLVANNGSDGIYIRADSVTSFPNEIYNCTIADNGGDGYTDVNTYHYRTYLKNCLITGNAGYGVEHVTDRSGQVDRLENNCVYGNTLGNIWARSTVNFPNTYLISGNIAGYPAYAGAGDYSLTASSPCIDYGVDLSGSGVTNDLNGNARSGSYDIGCYEYGSGAATRYAAAYVNGSTGSDTNAGNTVGTAKLTIGAGLAVTAAGGTCNVAAGTYNESVFIDLPNLTVAGAGRDTTTISGGFPYKVWLNATNTWVTGLTLQDGTWAGLACDGPHATVDSFGARDCRMQGNLYGVKGISSQSRGLTWHRRFVVERCIITNNTDGIRCTGKRTAVRAYNCHITDNSGDGIYISVDSCSYESYVYNCTLSNNGDDGYEDNHNWHRTTYFKNCIVTDNGGHGIYHGSNNSGRKNYVDYCNVSGNATNFYEGNANLVIGTDVISADPVFVALGSDYRLADGSPCIDAGTDLSGDGITNDVILLARTNTYDLGCYESTNAPPSLSMNTYVNGSMPDDTGAGTNWATAKKTIGGALTITDSGGTCSVAAGTYVVSILIPGDVALQGVDRATTILSGMGGPVVTMSESGSSVSNFTIIDGTVGVLCSGSTGTVENCVIRSNTLYGVEITADDALISTCDIIGSGVYGVYSHGSGSRHFTINRTIVSGNTDDGIYGVNKTGLTARNCLFTDNGDDGIYISSDNSGYDSYIDYCTFANNGGDGYEDAHRFHYTTYLTNCIVSGNSGYGIHRSYAGTPSRDDYVAYSCVYSNALGDFQGEKIVQGSGMITNLVPRLDEDYRLLAGSPCVAAAIDIGVAIDLAGEARPGRGAFDMGAYEWKPSAGLVITIR